jgi:hypothetical protein
MLELSRFESRLLGAQDQRPIPPERCVNVSARFFTATAFQASNGFSESTALLIAVLPIFTQWPVRLGFPTGRGAPWLLHARDGDSPIGWKPSTEGQM